MSALRPAQRRWVHVDKPRESEGGEERGRRGGKKTGEEVTV